MTLNLRVNNESNSWLSGTGPALAGVSSFGFGGTNVHLIVREAGNEEQHREQNKNSDSASSNFYLLPLSAKSPVALQSLADGFKELLAADSSIPANDICYAAGLRRSHYEYRLAVTGNSGKDLYSGLKAFIQGRAFPQYLYWQRGFTSSAKGCLRFFRPGRAMVWNGA